MKKTIISLVFPILISVQTLFAQDNALNPTAIKEMIQQEENVLKDLDSLVLKELSDGAVSYEFSENKREVQNGRDILSFTVTATLSKQVISDIVNTLDGLSNSIDLLFENYAKDSLFLDIVKSKAKCSYVVDVLDEDKKIGCWNFISPKSALMARTILFWCNMAQSSFQLIDNHEASHGFNKIAAGNMAYNSLKISEYFGNLIKIKDELLADMNYQLSFGYESKALLSSTKKIIGELSFTSDEQETFKINSVESNLENLTFEESFHELMYLIR